MAGIFRLINPAPLSVRVNSRECYTYLYRIMEFVGWLPPPRQGLKRYFYLFWRCLVFAFATIYLSVGFALSLIVHFRTFSHEEFLGVVQLVFNAAGSAVKTFILLIYLKRLRQTIYWDKLDGRMQNDSDRRKCHKAVACCNYVCLMYCIFYFCFVVSMSVQGLLIGRPPFLIYNPFFDWRNGLIFYWFQNILEYFIGSLAVIVTLIGDTYNIIFIIIFRAHIDILKDHIRTLRTDPHKSEAENYEDLVDCITHHRLIQECSDFMRPIITRTILVQFLLIGLILGLTLLNIAFSSDIIHIVASLFYFIGLLLETFPFCYLCELLFEDSDELTKLLAHSHWVGAEPKYKSTLRIFMLHLQQPIIFIAGGIFTISINSNIKVAKIAFSVLTIMQKMNLADRLI